MINDDVTGRGPALVLIVADRVLQVIEASGLPAEGRLAVTDIVGAVLRCGGSVRMSEKSIDVPIQNQSTQCTGQP